MGSKGRVYVTPIGGVTETANTCFLVEAVDESGETTAIIVDYGANPNGDRNLHELDARCDRVSGMDKVKGVLISHAHYDHIGMSFAACHKYQAPMHTSIKGKYFAMAICKKAEIPTPEIVIIKYDEPFSIGPFTIEPFRVEHSIPESFGFKISAFEKKIAHFGDFKLTGMHISSRERSLERFRQIGSDGINLQVMDTLYAKHPDITPPEGDAVEALYKLIREKPTSRHFLIMISSNHGRMIELWNAVHKDGMYVGFAGASMHTTAHILEQVFRNTVSDFRMRDLAHIGLEERNIIFGTGSQAEDKSFLTRYVLEETDYTPWTRGKGDRLYISGNLIPSGNPKLWEAKVLTMSALLEEAIGAGVEVFVNQGQAEILKVPGLHEAVTHVSGHEYGGGQKLTVQATGAKAVLPYHSPRMDLPFLQELFGPDVKVLDPVLNQRIEVV